jgi:hypothetical protein
MPLGITAATTLDVARSLLAGPAIIRLPRALSLPAWTLLAHVFTFMNYISYFTSLNPLSSSNGVVCFTL